MNARWGARIALLFILLLFILLMADLQHRLVQMQRMRRPPATSTTGTR
jgi:hypothetical protein